MDSWQYCQQLKTGTHAKIFRDTRKFSSLLFLVVGRNGSNMGHWSSDQFLEKEGTVWSVSFTTLWSVGLGGLEWEATDKYLFKEWIIWSVPFYHRVVRWGEQLPLLTPNNPIWRLSPSQLGRRPPNNGQQRHPGRQPRGGNLEFDNDFHRGRIFIIAILRTTRISTEAGFPLWKFHWRIISSVRWSKSLWSFANLLLKLNRIRQTQCGIHFNFKVL